MSRSAIPRPLIPSMMLVMAVAAANRAAFTVGWVDVKPSVTRATSGTMVTLPVPVTVMLCGAGSDAVGAALTGPLWTESAATATTSAAPDAATNDRTELVMGVTFA